MAYLYKGMAGLGAGSETSGSVLLAWHEKVRGPSIGMLSCILTPARPGRWRWMHRQSHD